MKLYPVLILLNISVLGAGLSHKAASQNISGVVNSYHKVTAINTATNTLTLSSAAGLSPGVKVLIIQMKGAIIDNTNASSFGNVTAIGNAGNYEFNTVCGVSGNNVMLVFTLLKTYTVGGLVQLVSVPQYTNAVITDTLKAAAWDAATGTGGIIALEASGSITLTKPIDAAGKGFKGGAYLDFPQPPYNCDFSTPISNFGFSNPVSGFQTGGSKGEGITANTGIECGRGKLANGGGGANNHNAGGAGGANYGAGGQGGQRTNEGVLTCHGAFPGVGGLGLSGFAYAVANNRVFMGGGGGAGHGNNNVGMPGGNGGGIIFIKTDVLNGNNQIISANGGRPYRADLADPYAAGGDGGGGGGAGGVIVADVNTYSNVVFEAKGADGSYSSYAPSSGCFGPGGGGGGGVVWIKQSAAPVGLTNAVAGGANGLVSVTTSVTACRGSANGATAGAAGNLALNYAAPVSSSPACIPLPLNELVYFNAKAIGDGVELSWKMRSIEGINNYEIERSVDKLNFTTVATVQNNHNFIFSVNDERLPAEYLYYRLKIKYEDGRKLYSSAVLVKTASRFQLLGLSAGNVWLRSASEGTAEIHIYNTSSQKLFSKNYPVHKGVNQLGIDAQSLPRGAYILIVTMDGKRAARSFLKE